MNIKPIEWRDGKIILLDQTRLPWEETYLELTDVAGICEAIKALLTESRKAAFSVFVATHSERVKALGIEGEGDLKDGFAVVRLTIVDGQRQASIDRGNGEVSAILPSPYISQRVMDTGEFVNLEVEPTPTEAAILTLYEQGKSFREISHCVYQQHGQFYNDKIKQVLAKFGER